MNVTRLRPPPYELFFAPLQVVLTPNDFERVRFAYIASKYGHSGQVRDDGTRYFDHPKATAWIYIDEFGGRDPELIINMLAHDLQEDTYLLSPYRFAINFGVERALDLRALTKLPKGKETVEQYLKRVTARGFRTIIAKLVDRLHNLRTLHTCTPDKQVRMIEETKSYHIPMLLEALRECGEPWAVMADRMEEKFEEVLASLQHK